MCFIQSSDHCLLRCDRIEGFDLLNAGAGFLYQLVGSALAQGGNSGAKALACVSIGTLCLGFLQQ